MVEKVKTYQLSQQFGHQSDLITTMQVFALTQGYAVPQKDSSNDKGEGSQAWKQGVQIYSDDISRLNSWFS